MAMTLKCAEGTDTCVPVNNLTFTQTVDNTFLNAVPVTSISEGHHQVPVGSSGNCSDECTQVLHFIVTPDNSYSLSFHFNNHPESTAFSETYSMVGNENLIDEALTIDGQLLLPTGKDEIAYLTPYGNRPATTYATYAKFNRPDPMRDWNWLRPHTMNLYEYVGNAPVNAWDPLGLYVFESTGDEELDAVLQFNYEVALDARLASDDLDIVEAAASYGEYGDDSVIVSFDNINLASTADASQGSEFETVANDDGSITVKQKYSKVTFRCEKVLKEGSSFQSDQGHEGSYQNDDLLFFNSWNQSTESFDPAFSPTIEQTESKAYLISHKIAKKKQKNS